MVFQIKVHVLVLVVEFPSLWGSPPPLHPHIQVGLNSGGYGGGEGGPDRSKVMCFYLNDHQTE